MRRRAFGPVSEHEQSTSSHCQQAKHNPIDVHQFLRRGYPRLQAWGGAASPECWNIETYSTEPALAGTVGPSAQDTLSGATVPKQPLEHAASKGWLKTKWHSKSDRSQDRPWAASKSASKLALVSETSPRGNVRAGKSSLAAGETSAQRESPSL